MVTTSGTTQNASLPPRLGHSTPQAFTSRLKAIVAFVQPLVIPLAVIFGGVWTLYTFNAQLYVENAQAQLQKLKREIAAEPRLEIDINTAQLDVPGTSDRYVQGTINVKNVGTANTLLRFPMPPVQIYQVTAGKAEIWSGQRSVDLRAGPGDRRGGLLCQTSATTRADFIAPVNAAGLYVVTFSAIRNRAETAAVRILDVDGRIKWEAVKIEWKAVHYFTIR